MDLFEYLQSIYIPYLIAKWDEFCLVVNFDIDQFNEWSDHTPLTFGLRSNTVRKINEHTENTYYKWNDDKKETFRSILISKLPDLNGVTTNIHTEDRNDINNTVTSFTQYYRMQQNLCFERHLLNVREVISVILQTNQLCGLITSVMNRKKICLNSLKQYNTYKTFENRQILLTDKRNYKQLVMRKRRIYEIKRIKDIERLRHSKSKEFWILFIKRKNVLQIFLRTF